MYGDVLIGEIIVPDGFKILNVAVFPSGTKLFWKDKTINRIMERIKWN